MPLANSRQKLIKLNAYQMVQAIYHISFMCLFGSPWQTLPLHVWDHDLLFCFSCTNRMRHISISFYSWSWSRLVGNEQLRVSSNWQLDMLDFVFYLAATWKIFHCFIIPINNHFYFQLLTLLYFPIYSVIIVISTGGLLVCWRHSA